MLRVLYLDPEVERHKRFKELLGGFYEIVGVSSAEEAVGMVREQDWDCVVLEIIMEPPEGLEEMLDYGLRTGVWVTAKIKELRPKLPICALTVVSDRQILADMRRAGMSDYILRPANLPGLMKMIAGATGAWGLLLFPEQSYIG